VTGGNKGLDRVLCLELAREGANVAVVAGRDIEGVRGVANEVRGMGREAWAGVADITNPAPVEDMAAAVQSHFGAIDVLVNNAGGGGARKPLEQISDVEWDRTFDINTKGTFLCSAAVARRMIPRAGRVRSSIW